MVNCYYIQKIDLKQQQDFCGEKTTHIKPFCFKKEISCNNCIERRKRSKRKKRKKRKAKK